MESTITSIQNSEAHLLLDTFQKTRDLTRWYLSLLKEQDATKQWEINGVKLNSLIWMASHLVWAEDFLIIRGTGGQGLDIPWLEHYNISSAGTMHVDGHTMKDTMAALKLVHEKASEHLLTVTNEQMEQENPFGFGFGGVKTKRMMVQHAIRHEAMHTGHLSWLCKINKIETV